MKSCYCKSRYEKGNITIQTKDTVPCASNWSLPPCSSCSSLPSLETAAPRWSSLRSCIPYIPQRKGVSPSHRLTVPPSRRERGTTSTPKKTIQRRGRCLTCAVASRSLPTPSAYGHPTTWPSRLQAPGSRLRPHPQSSQSSQLSTTLRSSVYPAPPVTAFTYVHKEAAHEDAELKVFTEARRSTDSGDFFPALNFVGGVEWSPC